jgi:hypothetical protein
VAEHGSDIDRRGRGHRQRVEQALGERSRDRERTGADGGGVDADRGRAEQLGLEHQAREHAAAAEPRGSDDRRRAAAPADRAQQSLAQRTGDVVTPDQRRAAQERLRVMALVLGRQIADDGQALEDLRRRRRTSARVEAEHRHHQVGQGARHVRRDRVGALRPALPDLAQLRHLARGVGVAAGEQVIGERAERVDVAARIERLHVKSLRRHERRRAGRARLRAHRHQRAEVDQLRAAVRRAPQVARADVAVDHAPRVDQRERRRRVAQQHAAVLNARRLLAERLARVGALEQLHRVVRALPVHAVIEHADDARVRQLHERVVLALEHRLQRRVLLGVGEQLLEREPLAAALVEHAIDACHAAAAELRLDAVAGTDHFGVRDVRLVRQHARDC